MRNQKMKKNNFIFSLLIISFFVLFSCSDIKHNYYKNLYNLTDNQKMWLPEILYNNTEIKESIFEVFENHDLDTNEIWGSFHSNFDFSETLEKKDLDSFLFNQEKLRKRLKSLNYQNDIKSGFLFDTKNFNCILYYNPKIQLYYYYGTYK